MKLTKFVVWTAMVCTFLFSMKNSTFADTILHYDGVEHIYTQDAISIEIDGEVLESAVPPVAINGRTMVPARAIFEKLGAKVVWIAPDNVYIMLENDLVVLKLDSAIASVNGENKVMEVPPKVINDSTMVPVRFVSEYFGFEVDWDNDNRIVKIDSTKRNHQDNDGVPVENPFLEIPKDVVLEGDGTLVPNKTVLNEITEEKNSKANVVSFEQISSEIFQIGASSKITNVQYGILQNPDRLYVDIINSNSKLAKNLSVNKSENVSAARASQNTTTVTRVVFELKKVDNFEIMLSEDRKTVTVEFGTLLIDKISFSAKENTDEVEILANTSFEPKISRLSNPDRIIIDIDSSFSTVGAKATDVLGKYISSVRTSQFDENTTRIVLDVEKGNFDYKLEKTDKSVKVTLLEPSYTNIYYENNSKARLVLVKKDNANSKDIIKSVYDDYRKGRYVITLNGDYSGIYGSGEYKIGDTYLESIIVQNYDGNTELVFNEKSIYAYVIEEDENNIYISICDPRDVYNRVVLIDAGHGDHDPGAVQNGVIEKTVNLAVSNKLLALLEADESIKVYATREDDSFLSLMERADMATSVADLFVSLHSNSMDNKNINGVQIFYPNPNDERGAISKKVASVLMEEVIKDTGLVNRAAQQSIGYDLVVLKKSEVPACLVEMGFLTNWSDAQFLSSEEGQMKVAKGVYEGIKRAFDEVLKK